MESFKSNDVARNTANNVSFYLNGLAQNETKLGSRSLKSRQNAVSELLQKEGRY